MSLTQTQRLQAHRQRRKEAGLKRLELWAKPEQHVLIKSYVETLKHKLEKK